MEITVELVKKLIEEQFPQWKDLEIRPVAKSGWDNRTFHLGDEMAVRLPSGPDYVAQVEKESRWLPYLGEKLDMPISCPVGTGRPCEDFPYPWSVNCYLPGETALEVDMSDSEEFAEDLAGFLRDLQAVEVSDGPAAGKHNFYRGGDLRVYHQQTMDALEELKEELPTDIYGEIWKQCISSQWDQPGVWIHGDVAPGNILVQDGKICAVIDFGIMGVGDPACDYAMAWTYFSEECKEIFLKGLDKDLIDRARGWALWKALITYHSDNRDQAENAVFTLKNILQENYEK